MCPGGSGPAIVTATVVANELPKLPHLDFELLGQLARTKIRESALAVAGQLIIGR